LLVHLLGLYKLALVIKEDAQVIDYLQR
jgi:hypothetical protein